MLNQCLESLVQKVQSGVVINFEKAGPDPSPVEGIIVIFLRHFKRALSSIQLELKNYYDLALTLTRSNY